MSTFFRALTDPKVWRTILVNVAALVPTVAGVIPPVYGAALTAFANVVNHMFNVAQQG